MKKHDNAATGTQLAIVAVSLLTLALDYATPLGYAEWIVYILPVALCVRQNNRYLPVVTVVCVGILLTIGFIISGDGIDPQLAVTNRVLGFLTAALVGVLVFLVISSRLKAERLAWLQTGQAQVAGSMLGEKSLVESGRNALNAVAEYVDAQAGAVHHVDNGMLVCAAAFATDIRPGHAIALDAGYLASEVVRENRPKVVHDLPAGYLKFGSALGNATPRTLLLVPITADGIIFGVLELAFAARRASLVDEIDLFKNISETIGVALRSAKYRQHLQDLLEETQRQAEELQAQQEELRVSNEELEEQSRALRESQAKLENQQAELEQSNALLEEHTQGLEQQRRDLLKAQTVLEDNARELARANRYKSEFLANMSHELRTPLNSALILSKILVDNKSNNLSEDQVRYARTIHASNNDLLALINDILDLSKIEAGHMDLTPELVSVSGILESVQQMFAPIAQQKKIGFYTALKEGSASTITTDEQRLKQILKNLLSNAFKFTEQGEVVLEASCARPGFISFSVKDTGIGISSAQQQVIFEAFRQADGTTSRKYGGTGLGLSISLELAHLLQGELRVISDTGKGSAFILEISTQLTKPLKVDSGQRVVDTRADRNTSIPAPIRRATAHERAGENSDGVNVPATIADDRDDRKRARLILAIEDDPHFAEVLRDLVRELDFDFVHATTGEQALRLANEFRPDAILLDVGLPDQSGLSVLEALKRNPHTRHIPAHMLSVNDHMQTALELGAVGYGLKPIDRETLMEVISRLGEKLETRPRRVLIVEDDPQLRHDIMLLLAADDVQIEAVGTVASALARLAERTYDCMVMDLTLPDGSGYDLLEKMAEGTNYAFPPVIVYTGRVLTREEEQRLRRYSKSIIIKGARSPERLLDEVTLFLHRIEADMTEEQQKLLRQARQRDAVFEGRRILIAEDDVRNVFALSSIFEPLGAKMVITRNGKEALDAAVSDPDIDLVLMDLMMPEMDGLTAMREIRKYPKLLRLPIIALTAKTMADDRQNCLDAGANDYIAKPVDVDKLVSLCRVWMPK